MNIYKLIIVFFIFSVSLVWAEKVEITSDAMHAVNVKKVVEFTGNVKIKQLENWLDADKVTVYFNENNETKKYEAYGSVKFEFKQEKAHYRGHANKVVYFPNKSQYILTGNSVLDDEMNGRHVAGDNIDFDMLSGNAHVKSNSKKPVKFIFEMESK